MKIGDWRALDEKFGKGLVRRSRIRGALMKSLGWRYVRCSEHGGSLDKSGRAFGDPHCEISNMGMKFDSDLSLGVLEWWGWREFDGVRVRECWF